MDDRTGTSTAAKAVVVVAGFLVLALSARAAFGDRGVQVVLLLTTVVVAGCAWTELTGRPLPRPALPPLRSAPPPAPVVEDVWRSERWIGEAVQRGLRALDDWRLEQSEA